MRTGARTHARTQVHLHTHARTHAAYLFAAETGPRDAVAELLGREVEERRHADLQAFEETPHHAARAAARQLVDTFCVRRMPSNKGAGGNGITQPK